MKPRTQKRILFIGRSMLWSVLLYMSMMLVINWDDVSRALNATATVVSSTQPADQSQDPANTAKANVAAHTGIVKTVIVVLKAVSGIATASH